MVRLDEDPNRVAGAGVADGVGEEVHERAQHEGWVADRRGVAAAFRDHASLISIRGQFIPQLIALSTDI